MNDTVTEGQFKWVTGESLVYSNWDASQPDNGGGKEDAVIIWSNNKWNDCDQDSLVGGFIMQKVDTTVAVTGVTLNNTSLSLQAGSSATLIATVAPSDATNKAVSWSSSNSSAASVSNGKVTANAAGTADITVTTADGSRTAVCRVTVTADTAPSWNVEYRTQIQDYGWENGYKLDGDISGTVGQSKRLEAIQILANSELGSGSIEYQTHIQNVGWESSYAKDGSLSGTVGQGLRLEAIRIKLTGTLASNYDVYYCVHAENTGWMAWAENGQEAGTAGYGYRLEGIMIRLVKKGGAAPATLTGQTSDAYRDKSKQLAVSYRTHVQDFGWQSYVENGDISGTVGQAKRLEGIDISLQNTPYLGGIEYRTHIENIGWENYYRSNGVMSGTSGKSLRLEAIQIRLTGEMANRYDVYYQVHAENFGWLAMAKNGEQSGTAGYAYRLEGIRILLVKKGDPAPAGAAGTQAQAFYEKGK